MHNANWFLAFHLGYNFAVFWCTGEIKNPKSKYNTPKLTKL